MDFRGRMLAWSFFIFSAIFPTHSCDKVRVPEAEGEEKEDERWSWIWGIEGRYIPTQPAASSVTLSAITLMTLPSTERIGWQRFTPPKVASVSDGAVQPPLL
jgi:hypothetical protein